MCRGIKKEKRFNKTLASAVSLALLMPMAPLVMADEAVNDISVVATHEAPEVVQLKNSPIASTVIDSAQIDKIKFTNVFELLDRIPGVSKSRNLRVPIGGKGYTIPLVDGFSLRNPYRGSVNQVADINAFDIERIEVIMGPSSALYSNNAFGGVINTITKEPPLEQESRVWIEAGDHDRLRTGVSTGGTLANTGLGDVGYTFDTNYWDIGGFRQNTDDSRKAVSGKLVFHPSSNSKLWVRGEYLEREDRTGDTLTEPEFKANEKQSNVLNSFTDSTTSSVSAAYVLDTASGEFKIGASYRNDEGNSVRSFSGAQDFDLDDMTFKTQYTHNFKGNNDQALANLTGGIELVSSHSDSTGYTRDFTREDQKGAVDEVEEVEFFSYAPYAQLEVFPMDDVAVTFGLRYEDVKYELKDKLNPAADNERGFRELSPKVGITYDLNDSHMIFAQAARSFAPPSDGALFTGPNANPDLSHEQADNFQIGMRGDFNAQGFSYDAAIYYMNIEDFIVTENLGRGATRPVNAGKVNFRGLEAQLEYAPVDFLRFSASYTYAKNKFIEFVNRGTDFSGNELAASPRQHLNLRVTAIPMTNLEVELELDKYSSYYTRNDNGADPDGRYDQPDLFNLRVNYETGPVEIWLNVMNLTDELYATRVSFSPDSFRGGFTPAHRNYSVGDGRAVYAGVAYNF